MEFPRLGFESELQLPGYATAHSNTGSLTHWVRPGIKPATSWLLVGFDSTVPQRELRDIHFSNNSFFFFKVPIHNGFKTNKQTQTGPKIVWEVLVWNTRPKVIPFKEQGSWGIYISLPVRSVLGWDIDHKFFFRFFFFAQNFWLDGMKGYASRITGTSTIMSATNCR